MRIMVKISVVALSLCLLSGCGGQSENLPTVAITGDCGASIRFHSVVYITNMRVNQAAPKGRTIGPGAVVECDHHTVIDRIAVSAVKGTPIRQAIGVRGQWHGVYVAEHLPHAQWPSVIRSH